LGTKIGGQAWVENAKLYTSTIELKELIANVASDVLNESKDIFFRVLDKKIVKARTK